MEKTNTENEKKDYYVVALNNNIRHGHLDNSNGYAYFYGMNEKVFSMNVTENGKTVTKVFNMPIIAFEKDGKLYDNVTQKEIKYAPYYQADGQTSTYVKELSYSIKRKIEYSFVIDILKRYKANKDNISLYINCLLDVEKYNLDCYNKTLAYNQPKTQKEKDSQKTENTKKISTQNTEFYQIYLNNNCAKGRTRYSEENEFVALKTEDEIRSNQKGEVFTKLLKKEQGPYRAVYEEVSIPLIVFKVDGKNDEPDKFYDIVTHKEIKPAEKQQANGKESTYLPYLTFNRKEKIDDVTIGNTIKNLTSNPNNLKLYKKCMLAVEKYNLECYQSTMQQIQDKEDELKRSRKIISDFMNNYGK